MRLANMNPTKATNSVEAGLSGFNNVPINGGYAGQMAGGLQAGGLANQRDGK